MKSFNRFLLVALSTITTLCAATSYAQVANEKCVSVEQIQAMMAELRTSLRKEILSELRGENVTATSAHDTHTTNNDSTQHPMVLETGIGHSDGLESASPLKDGGDYVQGTQDAIRISSVGAPEGAGGSAVSDFQIIATTDSTRASLKKDFSFSDADGGTYTTKSIVVSAPVGKKSEDGTSLATLDGVASGFEISFNYDKFSRGLRRSPSTIWQLSADCIALGIPIGEKKDSCNSDAVLDASMPRKTDVQKEVFSRRKPVDKSLLTGFQLKVGHDDFNYYFSDDLTKRAVSHVPWSAGGYVGVLGSGWYLGGGLKLKQGYKAPPTQTACSIVLGQSIAECVTGSLSPPKDEKQYLAIVEGRRAIGDVGVGIKIQRDFKNDEWGAEVPIFLFRSEQDILNGGVRFSWTSTEKFVAGIFVGVPFKFSQ